MTRKGKPRQRRSLKYRPSNGTEGEIFMAAWCERCKRDEGFPESGCQIIADSMAFAVKDPRYPKEWMYDEGDVFGTTARCTAFEVKS